MKRRNPLTQYKLPTMIHIARDLSGCDPMPEPSLTWLCPECQSQHRKCPSYLIYFQCACGWEGTLNDLRLGRTMSCPITT